MAGRLESISVVIPVRSDEQDTAALRLLLEKEGAEVFVTTGQSRAHALNEGAKQATRKFLWFVHADTLISDQALAALKQALDTRPEALHYFDLAFADGTPLMSFNALGANIRSRFFGCPFGDQALCIRKDLFATLGGYDETAPYGEDHLFVWQARRRGIPLNHIPTDIKTSARKYTHNGWLKTTLMHQYLWLKQALPQCLLRIQGK